MNADTNALGPAADQFAVFGHEHPPAEPLCLRAGPLTMFFEPEAVFLRRICVGDVEVIRGIYAAVRDRNWGTVPPRISNLKARTSEHSFGLHFDVDCRQGEIHFRWQGEITGAPDGTVRFTFEGKALTSFLRNRIGFCVLHPIRECAGTQARCVRADGTAVELSFPEGIEPQIFGQARFRDMRSMAHQVRSGCWAELEFEGDVFELEDQRNWTDASFKTYCTPLAAPFPVEVRAGTCIRQSVTLRLTGGPCSSRGEPVQIACAGSDDRQTTPAGNLAELVVPSKATCDLPQLGLGAASHDQPLRPLEVGRLAMLQLAHLRVDLRLDAPDEWRATLARAETEAQGIGAALELAIHLPAEGGEVALGGLRERLHSSRVHLKRLLIFRQNEPSTRATTLRLAHAELSPLGVPIGGGTDAHFCELNRDQALARFGLAEADFLSWPMTPQVHAFDNLSILETLEAQPHTLATARGFAGDRPLVVSPITLKPRFNAVATAADRARPEAELAPQADPRQRSLFAAAWTLGSLAALTSAGAQSITYFESTGWRGVLEAETGSPQPNQFPSIARSVFPIFHVFAALAGFRKAAPVACSSTGTLAALCLCGEDGRQRVLLANLTGHAQTTSLRIKAEAAHVRMLDETNALQAMREPEQFLALPRQRFVPDAGAMKLVLRAHAFARVDLG